MGKPRYKHKLNMLEPGIKLCKGIGLLILIALLSWWWNLTWLVTIACIGIGIVVLIFLDYHFDFRILRGEVWYSS
jgi:hypothetical protein